MNTSTEIKQISKAIVNAQPEISAALKDSTNPHFRSKYADLTAVWHACKDVLKQHKLAVIQFFEPCDKDNHILTVTRLIHESGEWMEGKLLLPYKDNNPQNVGSAITYARRYSLSSMLGIVTEEDDDGNQASQQAYSKPIPKEESKPKMETKIAKGVDPAILIERLSSTPFTENDVVEFLRTSTGKDIPSHMREWTVSQLDYALKNFDSIIQKMANFMAEQK